MNRYVIILVIINKLLSNFKIILSEYHLFDNKANTTIFKILDISLKIVTYLRVIG